MATLYRKYRPQTFAEIVNQDHIKETIQQEIRSKKLPHAFLFYGPRGVGKTTLARVMAKSLNCEERKKQSGESADALLSVEPCNTCNSCSTITDGRSMSLVEVDAASQTGVDNVRENIIANARVSVKSGDYKIFIIDEVHMLSTSSFNALLKTLEEPPQGVIFILATTEIHKIPETIISRCQRFDFHTIDSQRLVEHLAKIVEQEERKVDDAVLQAVVKKSGGFARDAVSLLGQILSIKGDITKESVSLILPMNEAEHIVAFFKYIAAQQPATAIQLLHDLEQKGNRLTHYAQELIEFARQLLLYRVGSHPNIFDDHPLNKEIIALAQSFTPAMVLRMLDILLVRTKQLKDLDQGKLPLELAVVELTSAPAPSMVAPQPSSASKPPVVSPPPNKKSPTPPPTPIITIALAKAEPIESSKKEITVVDDSHLPLASYDDMMLVWPGVLSQVHKLYHSVFIVLRTGTVRQADRGIEIAFRYRMHYEHVRKSLADIRALFQSSLTDKAVAVDVVIDDQLEPTTQGDVVEPDREEQEQISTELTRLADAFGGELMG